MIQCSPTSDCFKAALDYKIDRSLGKTTPGETKLQYLNTSNAPTSSTPPVKSPALGSGFDAQG